MKKNEKNKTMKLSMIDDRWEDVQLIKRRIEQEFETNSFTIEFFPDNEEENTKLYNYLQTYYGKINNDLTKESVKYIKDNILNSNAVLLDYDFDTKRGFTGVKIFDTFFKNDEKLSIFYFTGKGKKAIEKITSSISNSKLKSKNTSSIFIKKPFGKNSKGEKIINEEILNNYKLLEHIEKIGNDICPQNLLDGNKI